MTRTLLTCLGAATLIVAAGCSAHGGSPGSGSASTVDVTTTETLTSPPPSSASSSPAPSYRPAPAQSVAALHSASARMPAGEKEQNCPYIASSPDQNPGTNVADIEGDHVYRTAVITTTKPVGCRFYFYASPFEAIADIVPTTFATTTEAYNAMVATGEAGVGAEPVEDLIPGVDAVLYRTSFFGADGSNADWACVFATGKVMVVVHTQQTNVSFNARELAAAVAPKFS